MNAHKKINVFMESQDLSNPLELSLLPIGYLWPCRKWLYSFKRQQVEANVQSGILCQYVDKSCWWWIPFLQKTKIELNHYWNNWLQMMKWILSNYQVEIYDQTIVLFVAC